MKILCVIDCLCAGGAQRQLVELAIRFHKRGHDVGFLTYYPSYFFYPVLEREGIPLTCIEERNYIKRLYKMRRFIRKGNFNAVLSFLEAANFICQFAGLPSRKWKLIAGERSANPEILTSYKRKFYRWFHLLADYIVANSQTNVQYVQSVNPLLPKSKCKVIYNIIDQNRFNPDITNFKEPNGVFTVLVPARIKEEKNVSGLIDALLLLEKSELERIRIKWYGKEKDELNQYLLHSNELIKQHGLQENITFHEATLDITEHIQEADAIGLFSLFEGFPNAICEAMACAKPVICTKVSDMNRFLANEPNLLCDPLNPHSIKNALSYLLSMNPEQLKTIGKNNKQLVEYSFDNESIVSDYLKLMGAKD
ncbi:MAG: glycosyltransferase [Bacteroidales bacterium]|nr:glycosyltransferase [Bacteroidales bacterium]